MCGTLGFCLCERGTKGQYEHNKPTKRVDNGKLWNERGEGTTSECCVQSREEDNSEGEVMSEDEEEGIRRIDESTSSSELSPMKKVGREIRERNLKKYKMVKTRLGIKYTDDLTEEDKKFRDTQEDLYKHTHIGWKVVEASLIPSARASNSEANKGIILRYVHGQGYKVREAKESGPAFRRL